MPAKCSANGFFTNGVRVWEIYPKAAGWRSEYHSVHRLVDHHARRIKSEGSRRC